MGSNVRIVAHSEELAKGAAELAERCPGLARSLIGKDAAPAAIERNGRKAHRLIGGDQARPAEVIPTQ